MPLIRLLGIIAVLSGPCTAWAQPWADAYRAGDYRKAVDLLQPLVIQVDHPATEQGPAHLLAMLYAQGLGVPRDPVVACAMAQTAGDAPPMARPNTLAEALAYRAAVEEGDRFAREHCDGLTLPERASAARSRGCPAFGMPEESLTLGPQTVWVGRAGIRLADAPLERSVQIFGCPQVVARLRPLTIAPPADAAPGVTARHFIELLAWRAGPGHQGATRFLLQWQMYEVWGERVEIVLMHDLRSTDTYPNPALPSDFDDRSTVEMIRSGQVRWRMDGAPPERGWIRIPDENTR